MNKKGTSTTCSTGVGAQSAGVERLLSERMGMEPTTGLLAPPSEVPPDTQNRSLQCLLQQAPMQTPKNTSRAPQCILLWGQL